MANLPKIKDLENWQHAELLMQPAFIRIVDHIRQNLESSLWQESYQEVTEPTPQYLLCLKYADHQVEVDLWGLCYEICFQNYAAVDGEQEVEIDLSLIDDQGGIDWQNLDQKTGYLVSTIFNNLPDLPVIQD